MTDSQSLLDRAKNFFRGPADGKEPAKSASKGKRGGSEKDSKTETPKKKPRTLKSEARESMEAIVVAFILAFLFRTFEAEAFVIPTGSMAPTLLGRNKETHCPQCGQHIVVGASDEIQQETGLLDPTGGFVATAFCPNCRYEVSLADLPVFTGDRILVTKFPYEMQDPDRWDVIVFKYPQDPQTNYIKRLVGLPGEEIQIMQGDIYSRQTENGKWQILRKDDPDKQRELQILVYDNDHPERGLHQAGWPMRWAAMADTGSGETEPGEMVAGWVEDTESWQPTDEGRSYALTAEKTSDGKFRWLRYRHIVPEPSDWNEWEKKRGGQAVVKPWERLQIVTDFCGYNAYTTRGGRNMNDGGAGYYWVGDLTLSFQAKVEANDGGELLLELNEGPRHYRCRIDLATGQATLFYPDAKSREESEVIELGTAPTSVKGAGTYDICFANVDNRLCLWVDEELIDFGRDDEGHVLAEYKPFGGENVRQVPSDLDLIPVGIAAKGAEVTVSRLLLERDIYYRGESVNFDPHITELDQDGNGSRQFDGSPHSEYQGSTGQLLSKVSDPAAWYEEYSKNSEPAVRFDRLGEDEFFVLGDNSPRSKDSRLWTPHRPGPMWQDGGWAERGHSVPRDALVGKAFYIYWPHAKPFLNDGKGFPLTFHKGARGEKSDYPNMRFPFYPDFSRMERIR